MPVSPHNPKLLHGQSSISVSHRGKSSPTVSNPFQQRGSSMKSRGTTSSVSSPVVRKYKRSSSLSAHPLHQIGTGSRGSRNLGNESVPHRNKASSSTAVVSSGLEVADSASRKLSPNDSHGKANPSKSISFLGSTIFLSQPNLGEQLEPNRYQTLFSVSGLYNAITCVPSSASIWAANSANGCIDIFSACTGKFTASLPPRILLSKNTPLINKGAEKDRYPDISTGLRGEQEDTSVPVPTALHSTATHVWIGYSNGNVAICDHLVHTIVSEGCFHRAPVIAFSTFPDGSTVSGSLDGILVHWDCEANNFEAITRIKNRDASQERLSCLSAGESCWIAVTGYESGAIHITDISDGKHCISQRHHTRKVTSIVVLRDLVFSSGEDDLVNIWRYDITLLPLTTYSLAGCGGTQVHNLKLLRQIAVHPTVCSLSIDRVRNSLWVSYVDGLVERWSAHPDDSFGVEEVIREGVLPQFSEGSSGRRVAGIFPFTSVETLQVLALASNGLNNVWYGHYNVLEEKVNQSVTTLHKIITQDAVDTAEWRKGIEGLQQREQNRKERYVRLIEELNRQRIMRGKYELWKLFVIKRRSKNPKGRAIKKTENKIVVLESKTNFRLFQRYFNPWVKFVDLSKKRQSRISAAEALAAASRCLQQAAVLRRWMLFVVQKRVRMSSLHCVGAVERSNRSILLSRFYYKWFMKISEKKNILEQSGNAFSKKQLEIVESQSQRRILQRAIKKWRNAYHVLPIPTRCQISSEGSPLARFAEMYEVVNRERLQRSFLHRWREWASRKKRYLSLYPLAALFQRQAELIQLQRYYFIWKKFFHSCRIKKINIEASKIGSQIQGLENEHKDLAVKREYSNKINDLQSQKKQEMEEIEKTEVRIKQIIKDVEAMRLASELEKFPTVISSADDRINVAHNPPMAKSTEWYRGVLLQQRLLPSVLLQLPHEEALSHVMAQLKANVINLYIDMPLLLQMKERHQDGDKETGDVFVESFMEIKHLMMPPSKRNKKQKQLTIRWPLYMETLDSIPLHYCSPLLKAIKEMVIVYEFLSPNSIMLLRGIMEEILANADWIFLIFRACQMRRRSTAQIHH